MTTMLAAAALVACGAQPTGQAPPSALPTAIVPSAIEPSQPRAEAKKRLDDDDPALARCLRADAAELSSSDAVCSSKHPESCSASCRNGEPNACTLWARNHPSQACATRLFAVACKLADMAGCYELGLLHRPKHKRQSDADDVKARQHWERACDGGQAQACTGLGKLYNDQSGKWHDPAKALLKLDKGCSRDDAEGCHLAGLAYNASRYNPVNTNKAVERFGQACGLHHGAACVELGKAQLNGVGMAASATKAEAIFKRACTLGNGEGCWMVAVSTMSGGQRAALASGSAGGWTTKQLPWLVLACDKGYKPSCQSLAFSHFVSKRYKQAVAVSTKLITAGSLDWRPRYTRGMALYDLGRFAEAARDLGVLCQVRVNMIHCHLWLFGARERSGADGKTALSAKAATLDQSKWPAPVAQHFLGKLSAAGLMRKAKNKDARIQLEQECEANYYIGVRHMIKGQKALARARFQKTVASGITNFIEHAAALTELHRMGISNP